MANYKILHIDSEFGWRGGQQQAIYLHKELNRRGIFSLMICQPNSSLQQKCNEKNLNYLPLKMHGEIDIISAFKISRICKNMNIDFILAHSAHSLAYAVLSKLFYPIPKLIAIRRVDFDLKKNIFSKFKYFGHYTNKIVCVSDFIKSILLKNGLPKEKLITIRDGIDIHRFDNIKPYPNFRETFSIPQNDIIIGTVAALVGHKDYPTLLKAAKNVLKLNKNITFISIGTGKDEKEIKRLADSLNITEKFKFLGFRKDVGALIKHFDIFVMSSKMEGLGTSILDAQSIGLPVIVTKAGGIPEIVTDKVNGLLVEPENPNDLAKEIIFLIQNEKLRKKLALQAQKGIEKFSLTNFTNKYIELFKKLKK